MLFTGIPALSACRLVAGPLRQQPMCRLLSQESRGAFVRGGRTTRHTAPRTSLKDRLLAPATTNTAFSLGQGALIGGSVLGLGALCYYGAGLSNQVGAFDKSVFWPDYVKERIKWTYMYFGASIGVTAASAAAVFRSPSMLQLVTRNSWMAIGATIAAMIGSGMLVRSLPYEEGVNGKKLAWLAHCGIMGAVVAPLCFVGGPILIKAAWYTAGVVGGLSCVAACAPSEKFLNMGGPLAIGLGVVFASSLGSMFLPPTTALGSGLYAISLYGGLLLFSAFLLYDTQRIVRKAESHPQYYVQPYDPINASISIYLDTMNIFIRIVSILAGGGNRKR